MEEQQTIKVGSFQFGKWKLYSTSMREDMWIKPLLASDSCENVDYNNFLELKRSIKRLDDSTYEYNYKIRFAGKCSVLNKCGSPDLSGITHIESVRKKLDSFLIRIHDLKLFF